MDTADVKEILTFARGTAPYSTKSSMGSVDRRCSYEVFYSLEVTQMYIILHRVHCE